MRNKHLSVHAFASGNMWHLVALSTIQCGYPAMALSNVAIQLFHYPVSFYGTIQRWHYPAWLSCPFRACYHLTGCHCFVKLPPPTIPTNSHVDIPSWLARTLCNHHHHHLHRHHHHHHHHLQSLSSCSTPDYHSVIRTLSSRSTFKLPLLKVSYTWPKHQYCDHHLTICNSCCYES